MDVFVYGEIAHSSRVKRERYERWRDHGPSFILLNYQLSRILTAMAGEIIFIAELFECALQSAPTAPTVSAIP